MQETPDENSARLTLGWLIKLRWGAVGGQIATIATVYWGLRTPLPIAQLAVLVGVEIVTNLGCAMIFRGAHRLPRWLPASVLTLDVLVFTGLLAASGGAANPFSFLYLVYIALAAVALDGRATWALVALALASSGVIFSGLFSPMSSGDHDAHSEHGGNMRLHLQGMWVAFAVAAFFIVYFVTRIRRAAADVQSALDAERATAARNERLLALATLAAGAAHELATPLSTIAVVTGELQRRLTNTPEVENDVALMRTQVARCRTILDDMAASTGHSVGETPVQLSLRELVDAAIEGAVPGASFVQHVPSGIAERQLRVPKRALVRALTGLLRNAGQASHHDQPVSLRVSMENNQIAIDIEDHGIGMDAATLARAGEPFFTTKAPGQGTGLGIFIARTLLEQMGGQLSLQSAPQRGTRVRILIPA